MHGSGNLPNPGKFQVGNLVFTAGVNALVADNEEFAKQVVRGLKRHSQGDWGDLTQDDKDSNDDSLKVGDGRLFSAYEGVKKVWIITESDRSVTTVLFPDEY